MRVSRLEIFGFKSFMERLVLPLNQGITGIVGPNGCGKSNIVDAIRWVLGETRIKNLRGGTLEDVIFNGTSSLRPLGLAEVSITLTAEENDFFSQLDSSTVEAETIAESETEVEPDSEDEQMRTAYNLAMQNKYSWLKSATEVQITRRLYRSGESEFFINQVACRLKDIKELCNAVGLAVRGFTIVAQGEVSKIVTSKPENRRVILEEAAGVQGFRDKISATERRLEETTANIARLEDIIKEVSRQVGSLKRSSAKAKNRQSLKEEIFNLDTQLLKSKLADFSKQLETLNLEAEQLQAKEQSSNTNLQEQKTKESDLRGVLMELDAKTDRLRVDSDHCRDRINSILRKRNEKQGRFNQVQAFIQSYADELISINERLSLLHKRKTDSVAIIEKLNTEKESLSSELGKITTDAKKVEECHKKLDLLREELRNKEREINQLRNTLTGKESSLNAIKEQLVAASPAKQLRSALEAKDLGSFSELLVDGLTVPSKYVTAVQAVIAERAAYIVADDPHKIGKLFSDSKQKTTRGIGVIAAGAEKYEVPEEKFPALLSLITVREKFQKAANRILKSVFFVENSEIAFSFFQANQLSQITLVTEAGEIITADSFFVLQHESGLVQIKTKADSLSSEISELIIKRDELEAGRTDLSSKMQIADTEYKEARAVYESQQQKAKDLGNQVSNINGRLQAEKNVEQQIAQDIERARFSHQAVISKQTSYNQELEKLTADLSDINPEEEKKYQADLEQFSSEFKVLDEQRQSNRKQLTLMVQETERLRSDLERTRSRLSDISLSQQRINLETQTIQERFISDYGEDQISALEFTEVDILEPGIKNDAVIKIKALKERLIREGEIDPESIQRYEEESARLADLEIQEQDLSQAAKTLSETLQRLSKTSEERFLATFETVKKNFEDLIPRLFGGGKGSLELTDPNDPLNSGLEIIARPPGKKLKSIELLSGGEKAMCATALIMAMFMERPSPLCILDEVDAPLDEANLVRFLTMVRDMSDKTQFLLITHNKQSMAVADNLVGVTMEQPGASKLISVSLQEAYQQVVG